VNQSNFDVIVIGSGITGGFAAKEFCEKGLKTLLIERGRNVEHVKDYPTATLHPWEFEYRLNTDSKEKSNNPIRSAAADAGNSHFFADELNHPYIQEKPFNWIRGYQVGGKSLTWGRQCYRLSDLDFNANLTDGIGIDWPVRYKDISPWYDYVENYVGISGKKEGLDHFPDGNYLPPMEMNCIENYFSDKIRSKYKDRIVTIGRVANLTRGWQGRGPCQFRNLCSRGCPFGGYFSSNAATLPAAFSTGNLSLLPDTIVLEIIYDEKTKRASGARVMDTITKEIKEYYAKIIFVNASTIATASILLNSISRSFPTGLGNTSGQLGHNLMDHFIGTGATAEFDGFKEKYYTGRRPVGIYVPRFRNISAETQKNEFIRGYGLQGMGSRRNWRENAINSIGFGKGFKENISKPGPWQIWLGAWGETLPYFNNHVSLDAEKTDQWGLPLVKINFEYHENEKSMVKDVQSSIEEMFNITGFKNINGYSHLNPGGSAVHEMGTARMGNDAKTSVLNKFNQMHDVPNVFVTDGSFMTSSGTVNPSLTYLAFTARACDYAVNEIKNGKL
jgi:choline dehydrogenase-like flavoprotein